MNYFSRFLLFAVFAFSSLKPLRRIKAGIRFRSFTMAGMEIRKLMEAIPIGTMRFFLTGKIPNGIILGIIKAVTISGLIFIRPWEIIAPTTLRLLKSI